MVSAYDNVSFHVRVLRWAPVANGSLLGILDQYDVSDKRKTASTLVQLVLADIHYMKTVLSVLIVVWCSDAGRDVAKM